MTTVPSRRRPITSDHQDDGPASQGRVAHDRAAEQSALGAAILSKDAIGDIVEALEPLGAAAFYEPAHETIWNTILGMFAAGRAVTSISLAHELTLQGDLERVGGAVYLSQLIQACPSAGGTSAARLAGRGSHPFGWRGSGRSARQRLADTLGCTGRCLWGEGTR
ncbi:DnaB-like helicase N-terminal domain-containing protein [Streptomyces sp. NPDC006283]|uniref:DnaB-like helicase N-terminal domain-containing protein n=1 Tax=Streptomyces sp. NPDC006283 TaxID=3156741 RepID=UPI0033A97B84